MKARNFVLTALMTGILSVNALASGITVLYDGEKVEFPDAQAKIINERTMVPVRGLFEKMGFEVSWNEELRIATLESPTVIIDAGEDLLLASKNGKTFAIDQSAMPVISENRLYLPLRAISQATGKSVEWDANSKSVIITTPTPDSDDAVAVSDEGNMTAQAQEYLTNVFDYMGKIKEEVNSLKDPVLLELYKLDSNNNMPIDKEYTIIYENTHKLYDLEAPSSLNEVDNCVKEYVEIVEKACRHGIDNSEKGSFDLAYISELANQKEQLSMKFGVALVDYFNANNVYYEGVFSEYCLDAMN